MPIKVSFLISMTLVRCNAKNRSRHPMEWELHFLVQKTHSRTKLETFKVFMPTKRLFVVSGKRLLPRVFTNYRKNGLQFHGMHKIVKKMLTNDVERITSLKPYNAHLKNHLLLHTRLFLSLLMCSYFVTFHLLFSFSVYLFFNLLKPMFHSEFTTA